jgi:PPP family 3-phenylpropionic acid transporter
VEIRLALVWFLYLGGFSLYLPYFARYLTDNAGLSGTEAGMVTATLSLMGAFSQPFWSQIADRTGLRTRMLTLLPFGSAAGFLALYAAEGFPALVAANALFAFFHTATIPMAVGVSMALLRDRRAERFVHSFGWVRATGTVGFLVFVVAFMPYLHALQDAFGWTAGPDGPDEPGLAALFPTAAALAAAAGLVALGLPRAGSVSLQAPRGDWRRLLRHGPYRRLLLFVLGAYLCLHGPMIFYPELVASHGGTLDSVSRMWIFMVALEIPLIVSSGVSVARVGPRGIMAVGLAAGAVRWLLCGLAPTLPVLYASSLLHGVTVAGLMLGGPLYVEASVPERLRSTGQGLMATCHHTGAMLSSLGAGALIDALGITAPYVAGGATALLLALSIPVLLPAPRRPDREPEAVGPGA